jgi:hypothetical protein
VKNFSSDSIEARLAAGRLLEQRHQVEDPAEPDPAAYIAAPPQQLRPGAFMRMRAALGVMHAARRRHGDGMVPLVRALDDACLLQSPEIAAELERLRAQVASRDEHAERLAKCVVDRTTELQTADARVTALETEAELVFEYRVPTADGRWLMVRRSAMSDRWAVTDGRLRSGRAWVPGGWRESSSLALDEQFVWSREDALAEAVRLAEQGGAS